MQTTSAIWKAYRAARSKTTEYKAVIDGVEYGNADIYSIAIDGGLCEGSALTLGNTVARHLSIGIRPQAAPIGKMAAVVLSMRYNGADGPTAWLPKGAFYVDTRQKSGKRLILECYDKMLLMGAPFLQEGSVPDFPMPMPDAMAIICAAVGLELDNASAINPALNIEYPNELTMREVAGYIASANGGNFTITDAGKLRLVVPAAGTPVDTVPHKAFEEINDVWTVSRVTMYYDDEQAYMAGNDTGGTLIIDNPWATQAMCNHVLSLLSGYTHKPYSCTGAYIDPAAELGDTVDMAGFAGILFTSSVRYGAGVVWDVGAPGEGAIEHEIPYEGSVTRAMKRKVSLGGNYHGVSITRAKGLEIKRSDGFAEALFNSTEFSMSALVDGTMTKRIYFDPITGDYYFGGKLTAEALEVIKANIDVVVSNITITNILAAEKGYIAELTVDRLDTSTKVQRYLDGSTAAVDYQLIEEERHELRTASTNGSGTEQVTGRNGELLYWKEDPAASESREVTTDATAWPVTMYQYTELVKWRVGFEQVGDTVIPVMRFGAGTPSDPDKDIFEIYKVEDGAYLRFITDSGDATIISLTDFVDAKMRRTKSCVVNKSAGTVTITPEGMTEADVIQYAETAGGVEYTWPDGFKTTVTIG